MIGKVAFVTGAARGQGRSHAVRLARDGADIIAVDLCADVATAPYPLATPADLAETARLVEAEGRRVVAEQADVRDLAALRKVVDAAVEELGRLDVVVANAGIAQYAPAVDLEPDDWTTMIDINLTGAFWTVKAALGRHRIRVNTVHPTTVNSDMVHNPATYDLFLPGREDPSTEDFARVAQRLNVLPEPWAEPADVSAAVAFLCSDEARLVTGVAFPVDAGMAVRW